MPAGCTIAAKQEWAQARLVAESFREHHPDLPFFALLADEPEDVFDPASEPFEVVRLSDLGVPREMAFRYPRLWLSYALTPSLIEHVLGRGFDEVTFIKQESLVTGRLESMLAALERSEVVLTPHLLEPAPDELPILLAGVHNGGIVGVAGRGDGPSFLRWWRDRCERHCLLAVEGGMHYEQRWLDLAPALFGGVELLRDPGVNIGHWNVDQRAASVEGASLVRFSGFDEREPERVTKYKDRRVSDLGPGEPVWRRYAERLLAAGMETTRGWSYAYEEFGDGVRVPDMARAIYRDQDDVARFGDPFGEGFLAWLCEPVDDGSPTVIRLWDEICRRRVDVRRGFPDHLGEDRWNFTTWARRHGAGEEGFEGPLA